MQKKLVQLERIDTRNNKELVDKPFAKIDTEVKRIDMIIKAVQDKQRENYSGAISRIKTLEMHID